MKIILLGILKGIGVLLAALLLLLLLILLVVLLSPIRYRLAGEKKAAVGGSFDVSWLFGAVRIEGDYREELRLKGKILWFAFGDGVKKKAKKPKKKPQKQAEPPKQEKRQPDLQAAERRREEPQEQPQAAEPPKERPKAERHRVSPQAMAEKQPKTMRRVKLSEIEERPPTEEELSFAEEMTAEEEAFFSGTATAEQTEKTERIPPIVKKIWRLEDKKEIFRAFGKLLKRLIKGILPGNFFLKATLGTGDVVTTGYLLGLAGILTAKFGRDIQIKGDFTKVTAEDMEIRIKGKIILGRLLWAVLAFIGTKPVRKAIREMIRYLRKDTAEEKKGNGEAA